MISGIHTALLQKSILGKDTDEIPEALVASYKQARTRLEHSIALNPYFPDAYVWLANSYWEIENDLEATAALYSKALDLDPDYDDVISARGQVYVRMNKRDRALQDLKMLVALKSDHADGLKAEIEVMAENEDPLDKALLVGVWQQHPFDGPGKKPRTQYRKDGTFRARLQDGVVAEGRWSWTGERKLLLRYDQSDNAMRCEVRKLSPEAMWIVFPGSLDTRYQRLESWEAKEVRKGTSGAPRQPPSGQP